MKYNTFLLQLRRLVEQTTTYVPPQRGDYQDNYDRYVDFPYIDDPKGFVTHKPMEQKSPVGYEDEPDTGYKDGSDTGYKDEQSGGGHIPGTPPTVQNKLATEQDAAAMGNPAAPAATDGTPDNAGMGDLGDAGMGDLGAAGIGGGMGSPGMEQEEPLTSSQIGRMYELKKIYSRLSSVETYLSRAVDESILELRKYVAQSIDLFEVVISNYPQYKENVDEIIVQFYEFLEQIYESLRKYYKSMIDINTGS